MVKNNVKSFTLIELLIVATIIVVLSGTSLAVFTSFKDNRALDAQVSLFTHTLEQAKTKASAGDVSLCGTNGVNPTPYVNGYTVVVDSSQLISKLILLPGCTVTLPTPINYLIPTNIVYLTPTFSIQFDSQNYHGNVRTFPIKNTSTNPPTCKSVTINQTGLITSTDITCP